MEENTVSPAFEKIENYRWALVTTRPRNEKKACAQLVGEGIKCYLPLLTKTVVHNRSKRITKLPMFPGYVFACPDIEQETLIRRNSLVCSLKVLHEAEESVFIRDLNAVYQCERESANQELVVNPGLRPGQTVSIKSGPFQGYDVVIIKRTDDVSVVVNLYFFEQNIELKLSAHELEEIS